MITMDISAHGERVTARWDGGDKAVIVSKKTGRVFAEVGMVGVPETRVKMLERISPWLDSQSPDFLSKGVKAGRRKQAMVNLFGVVGICSALMVPAMMFQ